MTHKDSASSCLLALISWIMSPRCGGDGCSLCSAPLRQRGQGRQRKLPRCCAVSSCSWAGLHAIRHHDPVLQTDAKTNVNLMMQKLQLIKYCFHPGPGFVVVFADPAHHFNSILIETFLDNWTGMRVTGAFIKLTAEHH